VNIATLNAEGQLSALQALSAALGMPPSTTWTKGQPRRGGKVHTADGLQIMVADEKNTAELARSIQRFVAKCRERGISFKTETTSAQLSVGFTVGESQQFVAGLEFSAAELRAISECGISLSITAYPTSDEANENESAI
jgi:hypothetical protein